MATTEHLSAIPPEPVRKNPLDLRIALISLQHVLHSHGIDPGDFVIQVPNEHWKHFVELLDPNREQATGHSGPYLRFMGFHIEPWG